MSRATTKAFTLSFTDEGQLAAYKVMRGQYTDDGLCPLVQTGKLQDVQAKFFRRARLDRRR